jgi:DNA-binding IclR family transcriptional regulator
MSASEMALEFAPRTINCRADEAAVVKSAQRTLEILEFFADYQRPASVTQVASAFKYPQSSTSALLHTLAELGYLSYDRKSRAFMATPRVAILGGWIKDGAVRKGWLVNVLEDLSDQMGELVALVMRNGSYYVQYIYVKQGCHKPPCRIGIGHSRPLVLSSSGRALLVEAPDSEIQQLVMRVNDRGDSKSVISYPEILGKVRQVRELGYASSFGEGNPKGSVISMPIPHAVDRTRFAVTVYGDGTRVRARFDEIIDLLRQATAKLAGLGDAAFGMQAPAALPDRARASNG